MSEVSEDGQRLDVWLYRTRLLKTRALASTLIDKGRIRIDRGFGPERASKPSLTLRPGHKVTLPRGRDIIHVEMISVPSRRGPAKEAQTHYKIPTWDEEE